MINASTISADDPLEDDDPDAAFARGGLGPHAGGSAGKAESVRITPRPGRRLILAALVLVLCAAAAWHAKGRGYKTAILRSVFPGDPAYMIPPSVTVTRPANYESGVPVDAFVSADVHLPNGGQIVDAATLSDGAVRLYRVGDRDAVPARLNTSAAGDVIVLQPLQPLEFNTQYRFEVLGALKDTGGKGFRRYTTYFTTAATRDTITYPAAFEKVTLPQTNGHRYTGLAVGPDHRLYACTFGGRIVRFDLSADGAVGPATLLPVVLADGHDPRVITGIRFDPGATASNLVLWVTHSQWVPPKKRTAASRGYTPTADDWTGKLTRLSGPNLETHADYVVGLPRSGRDHMTNQMDFGPDGCLYVAQGSNTAMGAPDSAWAYRPERLLSACVLRVDPAAIHSPPVNVKTEEGGAYDPFAPGAPVTIYASGLRNCYDLVWHRSGHLYAPLNGSSAGGNTPETPENLATVPRRIDQDVAGPYTGPRVAPLSDLRLTAEDVIERVERGGYYGHPNPTLGEYTLDGANPTAGPDAFEVPQYPVGTQPDRNWRPAVWRFGKHWAPCGVIEYKAHAPGDILDGKLLVARYSGGKDVAVLTPTPAGGISEAVVGLDGLTGFADPLDLTQDPATGHLYVAEFGGERITLVRQKPGAPSTRAFRQTP